MKTKKTVLLVEDHPIFRLGLRQLIERQEDLAVSGEAEDVGSALKELSRFTPDLVVLDLSLKGRSGLELIHDIRAAGSSLPILVLSMHDEAVYAERALAAGANGYIMKKEASLSFVTAIRRVLEGGVYLTERMTGNVLGKLAGKWPDSAASPLHTLTDRELEVLDLIGKGLKTGEIASHLSLSVKTVSTYRERIKEKLKLKDSGALVRYAVSRQEGDEV